MGILGAFSHTIRGFTMNKKRTWSILLTFVVALTVFIAFGGTVLAEGEPGFELFTPSEYIIKESGTTEINGSFDSVVFGSHVEAYFYMTPGTLTNSDGDTIRFGVMDWEPYFNEEHAVKYIDTDYQTGSSLKLPVYIDPSDFQNANAGVYTGTLNYCFKWIDDDYSPAGSGSLLLKLVIPEKAGAKLEWRYNESSHVLTILGTGTMNDFSGSETTPWAEYQSEIETVVVNSGVTSVGNNAFKDCINLNSVSLPRTITSIGEDSFKGCQRLSEITCPFDPAKLTWNENGDDFMVSKSTTCIVPLRFIDSYSSLTNINVNFKAYEPANSGNCGANGDNITWYIDLDKTLVISGSGEMRDSYCYDSNYNYLEQPWYSVQDTIEEAIVSEGITSIGKGTFRDCEKLASVKLPSTITSIGYQAFTFCPLLSSLDIPASVNSIGRYAFSSCSNLKTISIPDGVTAIEDGTFEGCGKLSSVSLPNSVTSIGIEAFRCCTSLEEINLPDNLQTIKESAFLTCEKLKALDIPDSVTRIDQRAFEQCYDLKSVKLPAGITSIEYGTFIDCTSLESVTIPSGVTSIKTYAFLRCLNLRTVDIPDSVTTIEEGAFEMPDYGDSAGLSSVTIPGSVKTIETNAFHRNGYLESVVLLDGVEVVKNRAFEYCRNIKSVSVPASVTEVGAKAFGSGESLTDIYCYCDPSALSNFTGFNENTIFHVPESKLTAYQNAFPELIDRIVGDAAGSAQINVGGVHLYGYTLSLAGDVGVNFWMKLEEPYNDDDNYMLFTVNGVEQKVYVSCASGTNDPDYISFRCGVAAKEMTDVITAQFYLENGTAVGSAYTYNVRDYANYVLTHDNYSQNAKTLVKAMLNYGACSQKYFNYKTSSLANSVLPEDERYPGIASPNGIDYEVETPGCLKPQRVSLVLESTVTLKLFFNTSEAQGKVFKLGDKVLRTAKSGAYTVVYIDSITALQLRTALTIDVYENDTNIGFVKYSPAKYCKIVLGLANDGTVTDDLKRVVSSLYYFSRAAENYNGNG